MSELHHCAGTVNRDGTPKGYGEAIGTCWENSNGELWVDNGEYDSRVNFCPYCGFRARSVAGWENHAWVADANTDKKDEILKREGFDLNRPFEGKWSGHGSPGAWYTQVFPPPLEVQG